MPTARSALGAAVVGGIVHAVGGSDQAELAAVEAYDAATVARLDALENCPLQPARQRLVRPRPQPPKTPPSREAMVPAPPAMIDLRHWYSPPPAAAPHTNICAPVQSARWPWRAVGAPLAVTPFQRSATGS